MPFIKSPFVLGVALSGHLVVTGYNKVVQHISLSDCMTYPLMVDFGAPENSYYYVENGCYYLHRVSINDLYLAEQVSWLVYFTHLLNKIFIKNDTRNITTSFD